MTTWKRPEPGPTAKSRSQLTAFLDFHRETILWKVHGVSDEDARRPMVASGTSLAGIVKHLVFVERFWFQEVFAGRGIDVPWSEEDPDADWRVEPWETVAGLSDFYRDEIAESRTIVEEAKSLRTLAANPDWDVNLRWILIHMIEETARHAGHADILREMIDGSIGE
jgi:uncharacterized damage-inducible protein DinB